VKITEAPRVELVSNIEVTGSAPRAAGAAAPSTRAPSAASATSAAPVATSPGAPAAPAAARMLPKTASQLPLLGLTGIASLLTGLSLTVRRRRANR